jgi:hypothetical protein
VDPDLKTGTHPGIERSRTGRVSRTWLLASRAVAADLAGPVRILADGRRVRRTPPRRWTPLTRSGPRGRPRRGTPEGSSSPRSWGARRRGSRHLRGPDRRPIPITAREELLEQVHQPERMVIRSHGTGSPLATAFVMTIGWRVRPGRTGQRSPASNATTKMRIVPPTRVVASLVRRDSTPDAHRSRSSPCSGMR